MAPAVGGCEGYTALVEARGPQVLDTNSGSPNGEAGQRDAHPPVPRAKPPCTPTDLKIVATCQSALPQWPNLEAEVNTALAVLAFDLKACGQVALGQQLSLLVGTDSDAGTASSVKAWQRQARLSMVQKAQTDATKCEDLNIKVQSDLDALPCFN